MSKFIFEAVAFSNKQNEVKLKKAIYIIFIFLIILIIGYWFDIRELQKNLFEQLHTHHQLQLDINQFAQQNAQLNKQQAQFTQLQQQFNNLHQTLAPNTNSQPLINAILQTGQVAGIQINSAKPQQPIKQALYTILPLQISLTGNYPQLINFINLLGQLNTSMTIPEFNLTHANTALSTAMDSTPKNADKLILNMTLNIYLLS